MTPKVWFKKDDFRGYARGDPIKVGSLGVHNPINWWRGSQWLYPTVSLWAFGAFALPEISSKYETLAVLKNCSLVGTGPYPIARALSWGCGVSYA